jgi:hypothetical protein
MSEEVTTRMLHLIKRILNGTQYRASQLAADHTATDRSAVVEANAAEFIEAGGTYQQCLSLLPHGPGARSGLDQR